MSRLGISSPDMFLVLVAYRLNHSMDPGVWYSKTWK